MKRLEEPKGLRINFSPSAKQYKVWQTLQGNRCDKCGGTLEMKEGGKDKYGHIIWVPTCSKCGNTDIPEVILGGGSAGGGKGALLDSTICTPFGFRKLRDIKVGQIITNPLTGGMQRVIYLHPINLYPFYRVKFVDGTYFDCTEDHLWVCHESRKKLKRAKFNNISTNKTWVTKDMYEWYNRKKQGMYQGVHLIIPLTEPVRFTVSTAKPTINPYVLGAIIGDGCISYNFLDKGIVQFTSMDQEIIDRFVSAGYDMSHWTHKHQNPKVKSYYIHNEDLVSQLYKLGIAGNKSKDHCIPHRYMYASVEDRIQLMQGLIDTDGYVDERGHIVYTSISSQLAEDVAFLVRSLGGIATITSGKSGYKHPDTGEYIECNEHYDVQIRTKINPDLCGLTRKKERATYLFNGGASELGKRITDIEYLGFKEGRCITVDDPSGLYVVDNFTVTHNSYLGCAWVVSSCLKYPGIRMVLARKELKNLLATTWSTLLGLLAEWGLEQDKHFHINNQRIVLTFWNGSSIIGLELSPSPNDLDFNRLGSLEITGGVIDEVSEVSEKAVEVLQSRIRYKVHESFIVGKLFLVTNPAITWIRRVFVMDDDGNPAKLPKGYRYIPFSLFDNPNEQFRMVYYNRLSKIRDKATRDRLLWGNWSFTDTNKMAVYHSFDGEKHLFPGLTEKYYNPLKPLILSLDFNINPQMSCLPIQINYELKEVYIFREIIGKPEEGLNNTPAFSRHISAKLKEMRHMDIVYITGDPAGAARSTQTEAGTNNFTIIEKEFVKNNVRSNLHLFNTQPSQVLRLDFINELLAGYGGWKIMIDVNCRRFTADLIYQKRNPDGTKEKKKVLMDNGVRAEQYGHLSDCFDYALCYYLSNDYNKFINGEAQEITTITSDDMYGDFDY